MSGKPKIYRFPNMKKLVTHLRDDLTSGNQAFVLLYAYNGTGKTRLSMEFKETGKRKNGQKPDTLYFNAFTEDLFSWDNDLENDNERRFHLNSDSKFFNGLKDLALEESIGDYLSRYADFLFDIDYDKWTISFRKGDASHIKVSRGEENIFIWCLFMAICERVIDGAEAYDWVKYLYIDDPITSRWRWWTTPKSSFAKSSVPSSPNTNSPCRIFWRRLHQPSRHPQLSQRHERLDSLHHRRRQEPDQAPGPGANRLADPA